MSMYNLLEYSSNYSDTTGSLWFYSKDEETDFNNIIENSDEITSSKYKTKLEHSYNLRQIKLKELQKMQQL